MDTNLLLYVMTAFVIISAIALCVQAATLMGMLKVTKALQARIEPVVPKVEALIPKIEALIPKVEALAPKVEVLLPKVGAVMDSTKTTIDQTRLQIVEIATKTNQILESTKDILESTKVQMAKVDDVLTDATGRAKVQLERVEMVLDDTMSRAHETVATVHSGIMRPIREVSGIAAGIKTAVSYLTRGNRPNVAQATSDEEMFI